ncbi:hypothetical protein ACER0C_031598 [Sarotherodon galilaeus]
MESRPPRNKQPPANLTTRGQHGREQERASPEPDLTSRIPANKDGERERGQAARNNKPGRSTFPSVLINESHSELLLKKDVSREQLRV